MYSIQLFSVKIQRHTFQGKKEFIRISQELFPIYIHTLLNITKVNIYDSKPRDRRNFYTLAPIF